MTITTTIRAATALLLFGGAVLLMPIKQHAVQEATFERPREPETTHRIYAPLPKGDWADAELVLNSNSPDEITVRLTFFSGGVPAAGAPIAPPGRRSLLRLNEPTGREVPTTDVVPS
jgi:hypothetical protein